MSMQRIFVPRETSAISLGADDVAEKIRSKLASSGSKAKIARNGSWGMCWLEPLIEVETGKGRIAYGPVTSDDVDSLIAADFLNGGKHALRLGPTEKISWLARQQRWTFARCGLIDPLSIEEYRANGGFDGFEKALATGASAVVEMVTASGLRGRGGGGRVHGAHEHPRRAGAGKQRINAGR